MIVLPHTPDWTEVGTNIDYTTVATVFSSTSKRPCEVARARLGRTEHEREQTCHCGNLTDPEQKRPLQELDSDC